MVLGNLGIRNVVQKLVLVTAAVGAVVILTSVFHASTSAATSTGSESSEMKDAQQVPSGDADRNGDTSTATTTRRRKYSSDKMILGARRADESEDADYKSTDKRDRTRGAMRRRRHVRDHRERAHRRRQLKRNTITFMQQSYSSRRRRTESTTDTEASDCEFWGATLRAPAPEYRKNNSDMSCPSPPSTCSFKQSSMLPSTSASERTMLFRTQLMTSTLSDLNALVVGHVHTLQQEVDPAEENPDDRIKFPPRVDETEILRRRPRLTARRRSNQLEHLEDDGESCSHSRRSASKTIVLTMIKRRVFHQWRSFIAVRRSSEQGLILFQSLWRGYHIRRQVLGFGASLLLLINDLCRLPRGRVQAELDHSGSNLSNWIHCRRRTRKAEQVIRLFVHEHIRDWQRRRRVLQLTKQRSWRTQVQAREQKLRRRLQLINARRVSPDIDNLVLAAELWRWVTSVMRQIDVRTVSIPRRVELEGMCPSLCQSLFQCKPQRFQHDHRGVLAPLVPRDAMAQMVPSAELAATAATLIQLAVRCRYALMLLTAKKKYLVGLATCNELIGLGHHQRAVLLIQAAWRFSRASRLWRQYIVTCKIRFLMLSDQLKRSRQTKPML